MKIRSITVFLPDAAARSLSDAGSFLQRGRALAAEQGIEVQTLRVAYSTPLAQISRLADLPTLAQEAASAAEDAGIDYVSLGAVEAEALTDEDSTAIATALRQPRVFVATRFASRERGVSFNGARAAAGVIRALASAEPQGMANLRHAAIANCPPGVPFFPAAYAGERAGFAFAWQAADLAGEAFASANDAADALARLTERVEAAGRAVDAIASALETSDFPFLGSDCSLAPFPELQTSIGHAFEALGLPWFGADGTLTVAALVTQALRRARLRRTGFSGLMLPVLEDSVLAQRAAEGRLTLRDLLLYSAVCGTGLDVCPLPGDVTIEQLAAILLDVGTLAVVLDKPLTARLMPIPGGRVGDPVEHEFAYFAPSRIMPVTGTGLSGTLAASRTSILASPIGRHAPGS